MSETTLNAPEAISAEALSRFKEMQRKSWASFAPLEAITTAPAAKLVRFAGIRPGQRVLDVACGTGPVAVTAARAGARVTGLDLTPELIERARENSTIAGVEVDWREGDAEALPFEDSAFDVVVSQYGHIFAPRPVVAIGEMLRVLKKGGTIAFSTWPPELLVGRAIALTSRYLPPPPAGVAPPIQWGEPNIVRERLGDAVTDLIFDRATMFVPTLSPQHNRVLMERTAGPILKVVETLSAKDPATLAKFRKEIEEIAEGYLENNLLRQDFLMTRARKA